ncbi:hypothetical protein [Tropicimonas sediminicola]|uniref:Uncharacterized protein n=1 Tax=Tropicimonas sediminicola TaxID=1031541 RepID=A0A239GTA8_9RHOB|nr:hypothetical protein [Tropicimonas sediminicola]SNS72357.1 hypothetical protein SAMN05421757_10396 [Tropicimonas sediminicola]
MANHAGFDSEEPARSASPARDPAPVRRRIAGLVSVAAVILMCPSFLFSLRHEPMSFRLIYWWPGCAALGGYLAGRMWTASFGHPGWPGVKRALSAAIPVSVTGALIGGFFAIPILGTALGPAVLFGQWNILFPEVLQQRGGDALLTLSPNSIAIALIALFVLAIPLHLLARRVRRHAE